MGQVFPGPGPRIAQFGLVPLPGGHGLGGQTIDDGLVEDDGGGATGWANLRRLLAVS